MCGSISRDPAFCLYFLFYFLVFCSFRDIPTQIPNIDTENCTRHIQPTYGIMALVQMSAKSEPYKPELAQL